MQKSSLTVDGSSVALGLVVAFFFSATPVAAQDPTTTGTLTLASTFDSVSVRARFTGDANANASAMIRFSRTGSNAWINAYSPVADRRSTIAGLPNPYVNQFRGSIVGLAPGTSYDVDVTVTDPDGVSGATTMSATVSTIPSALPLAGRAWYVGNVATNGDGSSASPFNTIANALAEVSPGDTIHLRPGSYPAFTIAKSGTSSAWIAIIGDDRDSTFIEGGAVTNNITIGGDYLQVANLRLRQSTHNSVAIGSNRHHVWLDNLYHEDVSSAHSYNDAGVLLNAGAHHVYVLNNTILSPGLTAQPAVNPRWDSPGAGIHVNGAMSAEGTFVFKGNIIIGGFRDCIGNSSEGFGGSTRDNTDIAHNTISGCKDDAIQMEGDDINLRIWGNDITADNGYSGIATQSSYVGPVYVFRNVVRHTWTGASGSTFKIGGAAYTFYFHNTIESSGAPHDAFTGAMFGQVLRNNIVVPQANPMYWMGNSGGSSYDYNLYYRKTNGNLASNWNGVSGANYLTLDGFYGATGQERHGLWGPALFLDNAKHIDASSPAYDRGVVLPNFNDADSAWPYEGSAPDIGAHEVGGGPQPPTNLRIVQ